MEKSAPILVITCAAIAREVNEIKKLGCWSQMDLQAITADLHARPEKIPAAVAEKIDGARDRYDRKNRWRTRPLRAHFRRLR
jgi:hypothetical protein